MVSKEAKLALLFDFENTVAVRNYEELARVTFDKLSEVVQKVSSKDPSVVLLTEKIKSGASFKAAYLEKFVEFFANTRKDPSLDSDIVLTVDVLTKVLENTMGKLEDPKALAELCEAIPKDCATIGYNLLGDAKETLAQLKLSYDIFIYSTLPAEVMNLLLLKLEISELVNKIIVGPKDKAKLLEGAFKELKENNYANYQICVVGDMLDTDMAIAQKYNSRSVWFVGKPWSETRNNSNISLVKKVDVAFSEFLQLPYLFAILAEDALYLANTGSKVEDYRTLDLPIKKRLRVGYYCPPKKIKDMVKKKFVTSNKQLLFYPIQINADLDAQGPLAGLLHKCSDLMIEEFVKKKGKRFTTLKEFTEKHEKTMVTIDPLRRMKLTLYRTETNYAIEAAAMSPKLQAIMKKHGLNFKLPYSRVLTNVDPVNSLMQIKEDIASHKCDYSFMLKPSEACQTADSHTLVICVNEAGLGKALELEFFKGKEMIVQQLVKHSATIYKFYTLGKDYFTYHFKKSLPSVLPIQEYVVVDSQKPFPKEWFTGKEEVVDKLNKEFAYEITKALISELDLSMLGLDYIIEEGTGDYMVIDMNYFSSFRHETDLNDRITSHILETYNRKVKGVSS